MAHISIREPSGDQPEYSAARPKLWDFSHAIVIRMWLWIYPADHSPETTTRRRLRQYQLGTARPKRIRPLETGLQLFPKRFRGATLNRFNLCVSSSKNLLAHTLREREARRRTLKPTEFIYTVCRNAAEKTIVQYTCESPRNGSSSVRGVLFCLQNI